MRGAAVILAAGLILLGSSHQAAALKISPFKTAMTPRGQDATQVFRIENNSDTPVAVQVSMQTWDIDPGGAERNEDAEDLFTVFPAQMILPARESRGVRVQWLGGDDITDERPYRVVAEQIPVNLKSQQDASGLKFLLRFKAALYIAPAAVKSDVAVTGTQALGDALRVTLNNRGSGHALMRKPVLTLQMDNGQSMDLPEDKLPGLAGSNMHAGSTRYFDIPLSNAVAASVRGASLVFEAGF